MNIGVFISYKREDAPFVEELHKRLVSRGNEVRMDKYLGYGREWREEINTWLDRTALIVLVVSRESMQSAYVTYEWCYAWFKRAADLHMIQIEDCDRDRGMFGLLMDYRNAPLKCTRTPAESEWEQIVGSIEHRLAGWQELQKARKTLSRQGESASEQVPAARLLGQVENRYHRRFALTSLLEGLMVHMNGYGPVQREVIAALENVADDVMALPYLIKFCSIPHEDDVSERAKLLTNRLVEQNVSTNKLA